MPRVLLTLRDEDGYGTKIVLPSDKGLATILSALAGSVRADQDETYETPPRIVLGKEMAVETKMLPKSVRFCVKEGETFVEVDAEDLQRKKRPQLTGRKHLALGAPSPQLGLRFGRGGA